MMAIVHVAVLCLVHYLTTTLDLCRSVTSLYLAAITGSVLSAMLWTISVFLNISESVTLPAQVLSLCPLSFLNDLSCHHLLSFYYYYSIQLVGLLNRLHLFIAV